MQRFGGFECARPIAERHVDDSNSCVTDGTAMRDPDPPRVLDSQGPLPA
jgi:hypothetical protein